MDGGAATNPPSPRPCLRSQPLDAGEAYSLEEAKQKEESDARALAASHKKRGLRARVTEIRERFRSLLARNEAMPPADRLPRAAFRIDPHLEERIAAESGLRLEAAAHELAWDAEVASLTLGKLKAKYLEPLECERTALHGLRSGRKVHALRIPRLTPQQQAAIAEVHAAVDAHAVAGTELASSRPSSAASARAPEAAGAAVAEVGSAGAQQGEPLSKLEERAARHAARAAAWAELNARRPAPGYAAPEDVSAIEQARGAMGDYLLKTDPNYKVSESMRVDAQKKQRQLALLDESIHTLKTSFNGRLLELQQHKHRVVAVLNADQGRLSFTALDGAVPRNDRETIDI